MPPLAPALRRRSTPSTGGGTRAGGRNGGGAGSSSSGATDGGGGRKMGRKMDASHLLNFSLPARQEVHPPPRRSKRTGGGEGARWTLFNKEKFVNASFSFMLNPKGDYTAYFADSDIFFRWTDILQILVPGSGSSSGSGIDRDGSGQAAELPSCPICLSDLVAPRMTKCGHVYCYSCVLQYLALAESKTARCPICNDSIHSKDLKSVRALPSIVPTDGSATAAADHGLVASPSTSPTATMHMPSAIASSSRLPQQPLRLIQRPHNTTLALPQSPTWPSAAIPPHEAPFHFLPDVTAFSRFMLASPDYIFGELDRDRSDLEREKIMQRRAGESDLGLAFLEGARTRVLEVKERLTAEIGGPDGLVARKVAEVREIAGQAEERARIRGERERDRLERLAQNQAGDRFNPSSASPLPNGAAFAPEFVPSTTQALLPDPLFPDAPPLGGPSAGHEEAAAHPGHALPSPSLPAPAKPPPLSTSPRASILSTSPPKPVLPVKPRLPPSSLAGLSNEPAFYFYQSADGRHVYLHPLDIRVLLAEFKTYASFPETLVVGIEGTEEGTMNEDLRKRCKYLAHLPTGCAILFVQVDLTAHVSPATLAAFETPLRQRRQRRKEKGKREERERRRAEDREREEEEMQRRNLTSDNFPSSWGHTPSGGGGGDDFEDALARSLWDVEPDGPDGDERRPSAPSPHVTAASSIWSSRSFAAPVSRSAEEDAEVAALWRQFEAQQQLDSGSGRGGSRAVDGGGASSTGEGDAAGSTGGKKKKGRGQKLVLTGGGRGAG